MLGAASRPSSSLLSRGSSLNLLKHSAAALPRLSTITQQKNRSAAAAAASATGQASATMDPEVEELIKAIHGTPAKAVVYATGGAVQVRSTSMGMAGDPGFGNLAGHKGWRASMVHSTRRVDRNLLVWLLQLLACAHGSDGVKLGLPACMQALSWLLSVPGASNTVLEVSVPYARDSLVDILGKVCRANMKQEGTMHRLLPCLMGMAWSRPAYHAAALLVQKQEF